MKTGEESHLTILGQDSQGLQPRYLGFATPKSGSGADAVEALVSHLDELEVSLEDVVCVGCDGTAANTGRLNGAVSLFEVKFDREVQRSICMLHQAELGFRHLFVSLDGTTTGPNSFSGPLGTLAGGDLSELRPRTFTPLVPANPIVLPSGVARRLSNDQKQLYRHIQAVCAGKMPPKVARSKIGPLCHARWITIQTRILRVFMSSVNSAHYPKLRKLAKYIIDIYFPLHMDIKYKYSIVYGALHLFNELKLIRECVKGSKDVKLLYDVLRNNCHFAHPHSILLSMLADSSFNTRKRAIDIIHTIRSSEVLSHGYYLPKFNTKAKTYIDMCTMEEIDNKFYYINNFDDYIPITEPPLIRGRNLSLYINSPFKSDLSCHTQAVERAVALTTRVSKTVCGRINQTAEAMLIIEGRRSRSV